MATKNIVPRADNEGNLGTTAKRWVSFTGNKVDLELATTQAKFAFDGTSNATITVADDSVTTIATAETGQIVLDAGGDIELNADGGDIVFKDAGATLATLTSAGLDTQTVAVAIQGSLSGETSGSDGAGAYLVPQTTVNKHNVWGNGSGVAAFGSDLVIDNNQSFATHSIFFCNSAGKVKSMGGVMSVNNAGQSVVFELWKGTPVNDTQVSDGGSAVITVVLLATSTDVSTTNAEVNTLPTATLNGSAAYAAGDVLFLTVRLAANNTSTSGFFRIGLELLNTPN